MNGSKDNIRLKNQLEKVRYLPAQVYFYDPGMPGEKYPDKCRARRDYQEGWKDALDAVNDLLARM